jgi:hypothetical protein
MPVTGYPPEEHIVVLILNTEHRIKGVDSA